MSRTPYFFVERFDKNTKKYELQHPIIWNFDHTKLEAADLFPYNGHHDLFSIVEDNPNDGFPAMRGIHTGLPEDCCKEIQDLFKECCYNIDDKIQHIPKVRWFTYADMYIYYLEHPEVVDYNQFFYDDEEEIPLSEKVITPTPIKVLMDRVDNFLNVMDSFSIDNWRNDYCQIRIIYWIE